MRARKKLLKVLGALGAIALTLAVIGSASAIAPYPDPPPDFTRPDDPLADMFTPQGGQTNRPVLVIFAEFKDLTFDDTDPAGIDAVYMHDRFFGDFPSVAGYFDETSNGHLQLTPAPETDTANNGAVNDGIVSVSIDQDKSDFLSNGREAELAILLQTADPFVDYSQFDIDNNGRVTQDELIYVRQDVDPDPAPTGSGTARLVDPVTLDGVQLGGNQNPTTSDVLMGVNAGTDTNLMTIVHEIGHTAFDMPDIYTCANVSLDLGAGTAGGQDTSLWHNSAWQAMHLGWAEPTVVTQSGYYEVPRTPFGASFILYDPDKGADHFFVVENRAFRPGTYDQGAADAGLVVWELDESKYQSVCATDNGFISLTRPDDGSAAWDPSRDPSDPEHTMEGVNWLDGTPADIAIRAIPQASNVMRVYFDVRGPGVLVDPDNFNSSGASVVHDVTPDKANTIRVPVMNTGEAADDFRFYFDDLPAGWSSNADELALDAGEEANAFPALIPAPDAATGQHQITVVGESVADPSVRSEATLQVNVVLDTTGIDYTGATYVPQGEPAGFAAHVFNASDGNAPIEGVEVTFELTGPGGSLTATGLTDADGNATANPIITLPAGDYDLWVSTERFGKHAPGGAGADFHVPTPEERIVDLQDNVVDAGLHHGIERSLLSQLDAALDGLEAGGTAPACGALQAFSNHVSALSGKHIPEAIAESFLSDVDGIRSQIGC